MQKQSVAALFVLLSLGTVSTTSIPVPEPAVKQENATQVAPDGGVIEIQKQCAAQAGLPEDMNEEAMLKNRDKVACMHQCVMAKFNLTDSDGNLKFDPVVKGVKQYFNASQWEVPLKEALIDECYNENKQAAKPDACNPMALSFGECLWKKIDAACKTPEGQGSGQCAAVQAQVKQTCHSFYPKVCDAAQPKP
ncbi:uncharacterized protein LOC129743624 [Uranotaenia lowii]|uniref:uncharacterized protein LOC129743624 n=1 Tax=Uranotaenia lowii TaxID=190385 RepID=UPI0024792010|nr:uncharacterized protein LOC129743624 [Uranotaenia lowii]